MNQTVWTISNLNFNLTTGQVRDHWSYDSSCFMVTFVVIVHSKPQTRTSWWHQRKRQRISQVIVIHPPGTMNIYIKFHSKPSNISFWMWKPNRTTDTCGVWLTSDVSAIPSADSKADERDEIRSLKDGGKKTVHESDSFVRSSKPFLTLCLNDSMVSFDLGIFRDARYNSKTSSRKRNHQPAENRSRTSLDN